MTTAQILGFVLATWGALGMYVAGKGQWKGWAMGLAIQPVWFVFALVVHSWPLALSPLLYGSVYARNLWRWRTTPPPPAVKPLNAIRVMNNQLQPNASRRVRRELARRK